MEVNNIWDMLNEIEDENCTVHYISGTLQFFANCPAENAGIFLKEISRADG